MSEVHLGLLDEGHGNTVLQKRIECIQCRIAAGVLDDKSL
jgi:hypothetical protein